MIDPGAWPSRGMAAKLVAVDGHGGSGKSTLAELLSRRLGARIVHTDDFASWDNPFDWWPAVIERVLDPIRGGATSVSYPLASWFVGHDRGSIDRQPVTPVMILEGVSSLRSEFRPYLSYGIFVDTPAELCLERGINRDLADGRQTRAEIEGAWNQWMDGENIYLERDRPQDYADLVIDGTKPFDLQLP